MTARAVLFIDGSNWYHGLKEAGIDLGRLDYVKMATKLVGPRQWIALRYYVGQVKQVGNLRLAPEQQLFLGKLKAGDPRISVHLGSADGDYTHAVTAVRAHGKKVFAVSASYEAQLAASVDSYIHLRSAWFDDCLA